LTGKSGQLSTIKWVAAIANLGLNAALIPTLGMRGAAITTLVSFALSAVLILARAQQMYWIPFEYRRILHVSAIAFVTYFVASRLPDAPVVARARDQEPRVAAVPGPLVGDRVPEFGGATEVALDDGPVASQDRMGGRAG
jgi:hypothetical protein